MGPALGETAANPRGKITMMSTSVALSKPVPTGARYQGGPSPRGQVALDWIAAFTCWDLDAIYALTTRRDDFAYTYLPASISIAQKTMKEWRLYNSHMKAMLPDFAVEVLNLYECTGPSGPVIAHIIGRATSRTGKPFNQEYIMLIHIRDESTPSPNSNEESPSLKVYRVDEFVDTRFAATFFPDERQRWNALRQPRSQSYSEASNQYSTSHTARSPRLPLAKL